MMRRWLAILALLALSPLCQAQLVTVPIPGAPGLSVTVATGTAAQPLNVISGSPNAVNVTMGDDDNRAVPLQFTFPFFGQNFTQSWMHSNGVVSFRSPQVTGNFCCTGENLATTTNPALNYAIMPLWTDLIAQTAGSHWYLSRPNDMTYAWYNVNQYGTNNRSSFEVKIDRQGLVDVRLQGVLVTGRPVTSGMTGDLSQGQYYQYYHGSNFSTQILQWSALGGTSAAPDPCAADPLSSPSCPNYASAYLTQQCTISALYDPTCPGYAQAYFTYQCSINPLYNQLCPGYAQAYYNQQCSLNPLYDSGCTGYAQAYYNQQCSINPLYDSGCTGYAQAYFDQQCSLNGLYDRKCPNYATAYATQQLLNPPQTVSTTTTTTTAITTTDTATTTGVPSVSSDPIVSTQITATVATTTAAPSASPAAVVTAVPLAPAPAATGTVSMQSLSATATTPPPAPATAAQPQTRAQQLQQARVEAARRETASRGQQAQAQSKNAQSLDDQVAAQAGVITAMGYNAAFAAYENSVLRDVQFYRPHAIYPNQTTVDNQRALRGLTGASDRRHSELTDLQYR
jgi:hypothetical protein